MISFLKKLFGGKSKWKYKNENPRRFDCYGGYWGNSISLDNNSKFFIESGTDEGMYFECHGWHTPRPSSGDELVIPFGNGPMLLKIVEVKPCWDPPDMFFATAKCIRYLESGEKRAI